MPTVTAIHMLIAMNYINDPYTTVDLKYIKKEKQFIVEYTKEQNKSVPYNKCNVC